MLITAAVFATRSCALEPVLYGVNIKSAEAHTLPHAGAESAAYKPNHRYDIPLTTGMIHP